MGCERPTTNDYRLITNQPDVTRNRSRSVKILVCMKQVPQKDAPLKLNDAGTWIREDVSYEVNEPDAFALEEALRQKEKHKGEVVVVTAGPARAMQVLREALAKGADRAIHLEGDAFVGLDAYNTARAIAAVSRARTDSRSGSSPAPRRRRSNSPSRCCRTAMPSGPPPSSRSA